MIKIIATLKCTVDDYEKIFTSCSTITNIQNVIVYKKNIQCDSSSPSNSELALLSKSPSFEVECNFKCPSGQIVDFNVLNKKLQCKKCPQNTYSMGGSFNVQFWNEHILSLFQINCFTVKDNIKQRNADCTQFNISQDKQSIFSGAIVNNEEAEQYIIQLSYSFEAKYDGNIIIRYKKDTTKRDNHLNGETNFYFDYDLVSKDNNSTDWVVFNYLFKKGKHQIALFYSYWRDFAGRDMIFSIKTFKIEGIDDSSSTCLPCYQSNSYEGASYCQRCDTAQFYSIEEQNCINCPVEMKSIDGVTCSKVNKCSDFDYEIYSVSECSSIEGNRTVILKLFFPILCTYDEGMSIIKKEFPCFEKTVSNVTRTTCKATQYYLHNYKLVKDFYAPSLLFDTISGWKSNGNAIFIPKNPPIKKALIMTKVISITSYSGYIKLGFNLNLGKHESFVIQLNKATELISLSQVYTVNLKQGVYKLELIYIKKELDNNKSLDIPVELYLLQIVGGSLSNTEDDLCQTCPEIPTSGKMKTCINTDELKSPPSSSSSFDKNRNKIGNCSIFTNEIKTDDSFYCQMENIVESKKDYLKFNIEPYHKYLSDYCQYHPLCYQNKFIGPLNHSNGAIDISIYFSLLEPNQFQSDFASDLFNQSGHIFVLVNQKEAIDKSKDRFTFNLSPSSALPLDQSNTKAVYNLGSTIKDIKLVDYEKDSGILVEYSDGAKCRNDPSLIYSTFTYYKCDKTITGFSFPKIKSYFPNHCGIIFEVSSPYFCKLCVSTQIPSSNGKCKSSKRAKIYNDSPTCIFDYLKTHEKYEYNYAIDAMNVLLSTKSEVFQLLFYNKDTLGYNYTDYMKSNLKQNDLDAYYLKNQIEYESCDIFDSIENYFKHIMIALGIAYVITLTGLVVLCTKYRRADKQIIPLTQDIKEMKLENKNKKTGQTLELASY